MLIKGGTVVDGTGGPARVADVVIESGSIADVGTAGASSHERVIDAAGKVVCPGFVDLHTHSDLTLLSNPLAHSKIQQGVTTEVVGNCGLGVTPLSADADRGLVRSAVSYLDLDPSVAWTWDDVDGYFAAVRAAEPSVNVATLVGHLPLHAGVVGFDDRPASDAEIADMRRMLADALAAGAVGLSTGLMYAPLTFATDTELRALAEVVAEHGGLFAWHLRDYADELISSVQQAIDVGARTGCRIQISHLVAVGSRNWGSVPSALEIVDAARADGIDVGVDLYPYVAGNAPLSQRLPVWAQVGGERAIHDRLMDDDIRSRIHSYWAADPLDWADVTINNAPDATVLGYSVTDLAKQRNTSADDVVLDLLRTHGNAVTMVAGGRSVDDMKAVLMHDSAVVGSDGQALDPAGPTGKGVPHPRSYGCFPRLFAEMVRPGVMPIEDAVRKCTGAPAARIGVDDRGVLAPGYAADVVILDLDKINDTATFGNPQQYPDGIETVIVNGRVVIDQATHTGVRNGQIVNRRPSGMAGRVHVKRPTNVGADEPDVRAQKGEPR